MKAEIKVIIKEPGEAPYMAKVANRLDALQELVGGYIEPVPIRGNVDMIVNEDGKIYGLPVNFTAGRDYVAGPAVFVGTAGEEFTDVPMTVEAVERWIKKASRWVRRGGRG